MSKVDKGLVEKAGIDVKPLTLRLSSMPYWVLSSVRFAYTMISAITPAARITGLIANAALSQLS